MAIVLQSLCFFFFYPYNQRYRVYLKGEKQGRRYIAVVRAARQLKRFQFLVDRFGENRGKDAMIVSSHYAAGTVLSNNEASGMTDECRYVTCFINKLNMKDRKTKHTARLARYDICGYDDRARFTSVSAFVIVERRCFGSNRVE
jgi:hypothetical protein